MNNRRNVQTAGVEDKKYTLIPSVVSETWIAMLGQHVCVEHTHDDELPLFPHYAVVLMYHCLIQICCGRAEKRRYRGS